jgi:hypothetical protein
MYYFVKLHKRKHLIPNLSTYVRQALGPTERRFRAEAAPVRRLVAAAAVYSVDLMTQFPEMPNCEEVRQS